MPESHTQHPKLHIVLHLRKQVPIIWVHPARRQSLGTSPPVPPHCLVLVTDQAGPGILTPAPPIFAPAILHVPSNGRATLSASASAQVTTCEAGQANGMWLVVAHMLA